MGALHLEPARLQRINVVGVSGSGKSTLARRIAEILQQPYVEMDALFWQPNWTETSDDEFLPIVKEVVAADQWVLDGNYSRTTAIKWGRAQTVVWVDVPIWRSTYQVISRSMQRCWSGEEPWPGCRETFIKAFTSRSSVIWWSISTHRIVRKRYAERMQDERFSHLQFVRLRSRREVDEFLDRLQGDS